MTNMTKAQRKVHALMIFRPCETLQSMADTLGVSVSTIHEHIRGLLKKGFAIRTARPGMTCCYKAVNPANKCPHCQGSIP